MKKLLSLVLLGGALLSTGCGNSDDFVFTNGQNVAVSAPVCVADAYTTNRNVTLTVNAANGVLANDTPNGATLTFPATSAQGGTITGAQDGSFTYTPSSNFTGTDTFSYSLGNSGGVVTCTVTITVAAVNGFYVDAANGNDATGSFTNGVPFATAQAAVTAAGTNQDIIVRPGTYNETVTLLDGQRLLGNGSGLVVNPQGTVRPTFTGQITLANGNTVDFIRITGFTGDGIFSTGNTGGTITNCEITNLTNTFGINILSATGNWTVSNNNISNNDGVAVQAASDTGDNFVGIFNANVCTNNQDGAFGFTAGQDAQMKVQVTNNTMTGTIAPGGTFQVIVGGTANFCADITGNTNDDAYQFGINTTTSTTQVEQLSQLTTLNSGSAIVDVLLGSAKNPVEVPDGFCGF